MHDTYAPYGSPAAVRRPRPPRGAPPRGDGRHVLLVVADPAVAELLSTTMRLAGYQVGIVPTGTEAVMCLLERRYDLLIVDATLPDLPGVGRNRRIVVMDRPPVLFMTPCEVLPALMPRFDLGDVDYVVTPVRIGEVLDRARVLLRGREPGRSDTMPCYGDLVLDDSTCQARRGVRALDLTPAEYRLLRHLLVNSERVLTKEQISRYVWGDFRAGNAIEKLVSRLRRKVDQEEPALIQTRRGFGYWLGKAEAEGEGEEQGEGEDGAVAVVDAVGARL